MGLDGLLSALLEVLQGLFTDGLLAFITDLFGQLFPAG